MGWPNETTAAGNDGRLLVVTTIFLTTAIDVDHRRIRDEIILPRCTPPRLAVPAGDADPGAVVADVAVSRPWAATSTSAARAPAG